MRARGRRIEPLPAPRAPIVVLLLLLPAALALPPEPARAIAPVTGRVVAILRPDVAGSAVARAAAARPAGPSVPELRMVTLAPGPGESPAALARRLRRDPRVTSAELERRAAPRFVPNDPALTAPETADGTIPGTPVEWWAARQGFPSAWDVNRGDRATVAVVDTGVETSHPELAPRVAGAVSFAPGQGPATLDTVGHGTHVASLACGAAGNGIGLAGAGLGCRVLVVKTDFTDASVAQSIVWAVDNGADTVSLAFGTDPGTQPTRPVLAAVDYAFARGVLLVAAAADVPVEDQGYPASILQPTGTGPAIGQGKGLTVTAADASDVRARFAGRGTQISLAGYGSYARRDGPPGIFGAFTANTNALERGNDGEGQDRDPCRCRVSFGGDPRYAYLQGTSMAVPMVAAAGALIRRANPDLDAAAIAFLLKLTARRPAGAWTPDLGWGILEAGAALRAALGVDRRAPASRVRRLPARTGRTRLTVRWRGADGGPPGVRVSGVARYELWRSIDGRRARRVLSTRRTRGAVRLRRGGRYAFFTVAVDRDGNREAPPRRPDARVSVSVRRR